MNKYMTNVTTAGSQFLNTLRGEVWYKTVCATEYEKKKANQKNIIWLLDAIFGEDHCQGCYANYLIRKAKLERNTKWES